MQATQILMVDHEEAMTMLDTLAGGDMAATHVALFGRLKESLELHSRIEEEIFYPALESFPETKSIVKDSYTDHKEIDALMSSMTPGDVSWDDQIRELRRLVQQHAKEEETELFPKADELLGKPGLVELGQVIQEWKAGLTPVPAGGTLER